MAAIQKTLQEEKKWEYMNDEKYCMSKVFEVIDSLPQMYTDKVVDLGKQLGVNLFPDEIREVKAMRRRNRLIADLINIVGKTYK